MRLLLIHGRGQEGRSSKAIEHEWMEALNRGFARAGIVEPIDAQVDIPFYGDKLDELSRRDLPQAGNIATRGDAADDGYAAFLEEVAAQATETDKVTSREVERELGPEPGERGVANWRWVQAVIRVIDRRVPGVTNYSIGKLLRDVFIYVNDAPVRRAINEIVAAHITSEPTVVVGHSLGSVVGYEVLRANANNLVALFVTVGSPLGIRAVRRRLATPLTMPVGVGGWYNAFDTRDVVALYPLDEVNFGITPQIENHSSVDNHTENRHGIVGYLDDAQVAAKIAIALLQR